MALISKLESIGNAIREKTGKTELLTLDQMPIEIAAIETGGGGGEELPDEAFVFSGDCGGIFSNNRWAWFLEKYGDKITTEGITDSSNMFNGANEIEEIPFDLNFNNSAFGPLNNMFTGCSKLQVIGKIKNAYPSNLSSIFEDCRNLRELPEFINLNMSRIYGYRLSSIGGMFRGCSSLRRVPEELLKKIYTPLATGSSYPLFYYGFYCCTMLDEIIGLNPQTGSLTSNAFTSTFQSCNRVKELIFATQEDGTPYSVNWKNQTIDCSSSFGYVLNYKSSNPTSSEEWDEATAENRIKSSAVLNNNSGITIDKAIYNAATYAALKDDPDAFCINDETVDGPRYSRYNHDSAVNTINSLPSTSNTGCVIKFKGAAGSATDGGAINTLTEEEIAVATAKGWTVTLV